MVKHIVFWKVSDTLTGKEREEKLRAIKEGFESLRGVIPGLLKVEIGFDFVKSGDSCAIALYSEFESRAALEGYQKHPRHEALVQIIRPIRTERRVVDYEV